MQIIQAKDIHYDDPILFLHIQKTAGTSYRMLLVSLYGGEHVLNRYTKEESVEGHETFADYKILTGHLRMSYGLYEYVTWPVVHLTIFREPVERMISHYYFGKSRKDMWWHDIARRNTIEHCVENNLMGVNNLLCYSLSSIPENTNPSIEAVFESAKHSLENSFSMFGFNDLFFEFIAMSARRFGWPGPIKVENESHQTVRLSKRMVPERTLEVIKKYNSYDLELYKHARNIYEENRLEWLR